MNRIKRDSYRLGNYQPESALTGRAVLEGLAFLGVIGGLGYGMGRILPALLSPHEPAPALLKMRGPGRGVYR